MKSHDDRTWPMRWLCLCALAACGSDSPTPSEQVDRKAYEADLTTIAVPRSPGTPHWQEVQDMCAARFAELGFDVERHAYATGVNVIGVRLGKSKPAERVVV